MSSGKCNRSKDITKAKRSTPAKASTKTRYSREDRKQVMKRIESLKDEEDYNNIFDILNEDSSNVWTSNSGGVFIDLSIVHDTTLDKIDSYLDRLDRKRRKHIEVDTDVLPLSSGPASDRTYRLSNYEQNIIKQRKINGGNNAYQEADVSRQTSTPKKAASKTTKRKTATISKKIE